MKDLSKTKTKVGTDNSAAGKLPRSTHQDVQRFLTKVATLPKTAGGARLIFALDATASRQATWDKASQLQGEMFAAANELGGLQVQLCYFRGFAEFYSSDWDLGPDALLKKMSGIRCEAGTTKLESLLRHALSESKTSKAKCVVFIGDAMEESLDRLAQLSGELGLLNIPLFMFQERSDPIARQAFIEMSRLSGGAYSQFDSGSAEQLKALLKAVAIFAAGGLKALQKFSENSPESVKLLTQQIRS
ncbi:MAG: VWA domain-containing protein [Pseudohongiellaceae bacterium]